MFEIIRSSHCTGESNYHLQFTPAYRRRIFANEKVRKLTRVYLLAKADQMGIMVCALDFGPEHIHAFLSNCKNYSVSELAQSLKGFVSRMMRKHHWSLFRDKLYGKKFWTAGYFYRSVGAITSESAEYYVRHAQEKHWKVVDYEVYKQNKQKTLEEFLT